MEKEGSKNVVIKDSDDKRQITVVLAATLAGCFVHPQILYEGKLIDVIQWYNFLRAGMCHILQIIGQMKYQWSSI